MVQLQRACSYQMRAISLVEGIDVSSMTTAMTVARSLGRRMTTSLLRPPFSRLLNLLQLVRDKPFETLQTT